MSTNSGDMTAQLAGEQLTEDQQRALNLQFLVACKKGEVEAIAQFLRQGAEIDFIDENNFTSLITAIIHNQLDAVRYLLSKDASVEALELSSGGRTIPPLSAAALKGSLEIAELLLKHHAELHYRDNRGRTALECAVSAARPFMVQFLIDRGADPKTKDRYQRTLIASVIMNSQAARAHQIANNDTFDDIKNIQETIQILIDHGVDINTWADYNPTSEEPEDFDDIPFNGYTPLMMACKLGIAPLVEFLVAKGGQVNHPGKYGSTPFLESLQTGKIPLLKFLVKQGADYNHVDDKGFYPFRATYRNINPLVLRYLASIGSMCEVYPADQEQIRSMRFSLSPLQGLRMPVEMIPQATIIAKHFLTLDSIEQLFHFAKTGTLIVKQPIAHLFNNGADFNQRTCDGKLNTPLHIACEVGNATAIRVLLKVLIQGGKEVQVSVLSAQNKAQSTPLDILATRHQNLAAILMDVIQPLIDSMMVLVKQFPIFEHLPNDVIQHLYPFYQQAPAACFANTSKGMELVEQMFAFASANADFQLGLEFHNRFNEDKTQERDMGLKRAAVHLYRAAKKNHKQALYNLAIFYQHGLGVTQSTRMALTCFNRAAKAGLPEAAFRSALIYQEGSVGVARNTEKSLEYLMQAAQAKIPEAMHTLALYYQEKGPDDRKMQNEAAILIEEAVVRGLPLEHLTLTDNTAQHKAIKLEKTAAALSKPIAHYRLGQRYENGNGVEVDLEQACMHYQYAAQNKIADAAIRLEFCTRKLQLQKLKTDSQTPVNCELTLSASVFDSDDVQHAPPIVFRRTALSSTATQGNGVGVRSNKAISHF